MDMGIGYLSNPYEKHEDKLIAIYRKYVGKRVELSVRDAGRIEGIIKGLEGYFAVIPDAEGKTLPTLIDIRDISILNPL